MALTVQSNGSGPSNIIQASWFNDYYNLLTGSMHDQPVTLDYRHGSNNSTPSLLLRGDGFNNLVQGLKSDNVTEAFHIDSSGNLSLAGTLVATGNITTDGKYVWSHAGAGGNDIVRATPTDGHRDIGIFYANGASPGPNDGIGFYDYTSSFTFLQINSGGTVLMGGNPVPVIMGNGTTAGRQIFIGTATPSGANEGDIWIKA